MLLLTMTLSALLAGAGEPAPVEVTLDEVFELSPGGVARVDEARLELRFAGVDEDSRCPVDVTCVWAGDAIVALIARAGNQERRLELHTHPDRETTGELAGYRVQLVSLAPAPGAEATEAAPYVAELVVSRAQQATASGAAVTRRIF